MIIFPVILSLTGLVLVALVWRRATPHVRVPLGIYLTAYIVTTLIGATDIALTGPHRLIESNFDVDIQILPDLGTITYWGILYAPLIVPPAVLLLLARRKATSAAKSQPARSRPSIVDPVSFCLTAVLFSTYCIYKIAAGGYLGNLSAWSDLRGDYMSLIYLRYQMIGLGSVFYGLVYIGIPTLSFCAMHQFVTRHSLVWLCIFLGTAAVTSLLCILIMFKGMLIIYLLFVGIGLSELKAVSWRSVVLAVGFALSILTVLQSFFAANWTIGDSAVLVIYRMASSYPYYLSLYPDVIPFCGIDFGLHIVGLAEPNTDAMDVFSFMYPNVTWVQGYAPGAAHVRAYSEAGSACSAAVLIAIGGLIHLVGQFRARSNGPMSFALYMACLVALYYLTQTSLRETLVSCYGIFWAFVVLFALQLVSDVLRGAAERHPLAQPAMMRVDY